MIKNKFFKFTRSITKIILPVFFKLILFLKINRRVINFLNDKSFRSNDKYNFTNIINNLLNKKLLAMDIGAQGGFNSDNFFPKKYNDFFEPVMIEPIKDEAKKLKESYKYVVDKGLWSSSTKKKIYILKNRPGSSSMYEPETSRFDIHNIKKKDYSLYDVSEIQEIECETISESLRKINLEQLDYLKIDTQGSEYEILKGLGPYRPLLIRIEVQIIPIYRKVPRWTKLIDHLYEINYILCDWKEIGSHATRTPVEMDMIFIPDFQNFEGKEIIKKDQNKFISLMLIFGQINLLKTVSKKCKFKNTSFLKNLEDLYFN